MNGNEFRKRYGPWALIAGASSGLGAEFAEQLAACGLNLVMVARRAPLLESQCERLTAAHSIQARPLPLDLADSNSAAIINSRTADLDVGLVVYNAAYSAIGPFLDRPLEEHLKEIETNCRGPLQLAYTFGKRMCARGRGGIILMSSLSALQGTALISNYTATKAYNLILAEGLWEELRREGIDVLASCPGATDTPNYLASTRRHPAPVAAARVVVAETLAALGREPSVVPSYTNKLTAFLMQRLIPRKMAIAIMGRVLRSMYAN